MTKDCHKFSYNWHLADGYPAKGIDYHGLKVFGTFICGGGSTMGYKLAGFDHLGGVEIDKPVAEVYKVNHKPKYLYNEDIRLFRQRTDLPDELYNLDLLDGSPPCSSFSMAGNREKDWDKKKVFREGQAHQKLDDLFFDYIALAEKLQPKVIIAENVKGIIGGNAKFYVAQIKKGFERAGYKVQLFLLNAASMGVPQKRERVFFVCQRNDLKLPDLKLSFSEILIPFGKIKVNDGKQRLLNPTMFRLWENRIDSDIDLTGASARLDNRPNSFFNHKYLKDHQVANTITSSDLCTIYNEPRYRNDSELKLCGSYPQDYNFLDMKCGYLIGMSVPPVMTAQVAHQVYLQWLSKLPITAH